MNPNELFQRSHAFIMFSSINKYFSYISVLKKINNFFSHTFGASSIIKTCRSSNHAIRPLVCKNICFCCVLRFKNFPKTQDEKKKQIEIATTNSSKKTSELVILARL